MSMESLLDRFFRAVSFEAGGRPDYDAIRGLFVSQGLLIRSVPLEISSIDGFIAPRLAQVRSGALTQFNESEVSGETQVFGSVAQRWSVYAKRGVLNGAAFQARGRISTQFVETPEGWLMTSMAWDDER